MVVGCGAECYIIRRVVVTVEGNVESLGSPIEQEHPYWICKYVWTVGTGSRVCHLCYDCCIKYGFLW